MSKAQLTGYANASIYLWQHNSSNVSDVTVCQVLAQDHTVILTVDLLYVTDWHTRKKKWDLVQEAATKYDDCLSG
jgi:hypothetical protein